MTHRRRLELHAAAAGGRRKDRRFERGGSHGQPARLRAVRGFTGTAESTDYFHLRHKLALNTENRTRADDSKEMPTFRSGRAAWMPVRPPDLISDPEGSRSVTASAILDRGARYRPSQTVGYLPLMSGKALWRDPLSGTIVRHSRVGFHAR